MQVSTLETAQADESNVGRKNLCLEMKMLHAIHMAVNGTKLGIIQVRTRKQSYKITNN